MRSLTILNFVAFVLASLTSVSTAQDINFGPFSGTLTTTVSQGLQIRTEGNNCLLVSGAATSYQDADDYAKIGGSMNTGNGGCDEKRSSSLGTSSKVVAIGGPNSDDGRVNFQKNDFTDASTSVSLSYSGSTADGVGLTISASGLQNHVLDLNTPSFKAFSSDSKDHLETNLKFGNAYLSLPFGGTDVTLGRFVQSQGVTALMPIGVNVVNPVSLPILRAPGTLLKDALLPQAMVGFNSYIGNGVSFEGYYQLEQSEVELDAAGSFFGSEVLGVGSNNNGLLNSANPMERGAPFASNYYDVQACGSGDGATIDCHATDDLWATNTDGGTQTYVYHTLNSTAATPAGTNASGTALETVADAAAATLSAVGGSTTNMASSYSAWATAGVGGAIAAGNSTVADSAAGMAISKDIFTTAGSMGSVAFDAITDAEFLTAYRTLAAHGTAFGYGTNFGLVDVKRAPDALAKEEGQFGLNLSGYADNIGNGIEWGVYFNNSHSNAPRVRILSITNGYATHLYGQYLQGTTALLGGRFDLTNTNSGATAALDTALEQAIGTVAFGPTICAAFLGIPALGNPKLGKWSNATHLHDPASCYNTAATIGKTASFVGGAAGAAATLGYTNAARYQAYYPEDIQTFGASMSTNIGSTTMNVEVAYRPDYPFQIDISDLLNNQIDSSGGSLVQSATVIAATYGSTTVGFAGAPAAALGASLVSRVTDQRWSSAPLCDLSSAGNQSLEVSGYNYCDGTAEFDAWTADVNFISFLAPSNPIVQEMGADSGSWLLEFGAVAVPSIDYNQGVVSAGHFYSGHDVNQNGCNDTSGGSKLLTPQANSLFGTGYCDDAKRTGADDLAVQAKFRGSLNYNNINNSQWNFSPSISWDHGIAGNAPSSLGGWTEESYQLGLGASFSNPNGMAVNVNYTNRLGEVMQNKSTDKDTLSASVSYAF